MKPFRDDAEIAAALRETRPAPRPEFAARLDARAARGFPRQPRLAIPGLSRLRETLSAAPPRRLLGAGGAVAVAAIVVATAVVATSETESPTSPVRPLAHPVERSVRPAVAPRAEQAAPTPRASGGAAAATGNASSHVAGSETQSDGVQLESAPAPGSGPYASHAARRDVERGAQIVLAAEPEEVRADAAKVFDAVHAADGIVLSSSIRDGKAGDAGAEFELLIPAGKLGDSLAALSRIAEVRSRNESTQDITAPTVGVAERLRDSRASIEGLLGRLAAAGTEEERAAVEAELRAERRRGAALRSRLSSLRRRAGFSRVSVRIETGAAPSREGGGWGIGDGLDDAGRILAIAGGVTAIGLAILAPFALIALLAWLARRAWVRHARRAALG
jgi:hypothetical protein